MSETDAPIIVAFIEHHGRYRVEFDYDPSAVAILKARRPGRCAPLGAQGQALEGQRRLDGPAGVGVHERRNQGDRAQPHQHRGLVRRLLCADADQSQRPPRLHKGLCKTCESVPYRPGGSNAKTATASA